LSGALSGVVSRVGHANRLTANAHGRQHQRGTQLLRSPVGVVRQGPAALPASHEKFARTQDGRHGARRARGW
jgi:hypothetical protein